MRALITALTALAVAGTLAACGGDDRLSAEEYRAEAVKICQQADRATEAVEQPTKATPKAISAYFRTLLAPNEKATRQFGELSPPEDLQEAHDEVLAVNREGAKVVRGVIAKVDGGEDPATVLQAATSELEALNARARKAAGELGVPACADE